LREVKVLQTIDDRDNPDYIENNGPFKCNRNDTWLGFGYYFWETFIDNAHWWGKSRADYKSYIITEASIDFNESNCFDLVGNTEHLELFQVTAKKLLKFSNDKDEITVPRVIDFIYKSKVLTFTSVRANGVNTKSNHYSEDNFHLKFDKKYGAFLEITPTIQICLYNLKAHNFKNYKIIYPKNYTF
jgi:hypothetical protein